MLHYLFQWSRRPLISVVRQRGGGGGVQFSSQILRGLEQIFINISFATGMLDVSTQSHSHRNGDKKRCLLDMSYLGIPFLKSRRHHANLRSDDNSPIRCLLIFWSGCQKMSRTRMKS